MNGVDKAFIFLLLITAYIVLWLTETVIFIKRRFVDQRQQRQARSATAPALPAVPAPAEPDAPPPDDEVLRELGAFDATEEEAEAQPAAASEAEGATVRHPKQA